MEATEFIIGQPVVKGQYKTSQGQTFLALQDIKKPGSLPRVGAYYQLVTSDQPWLQRLSGGEPALFVATTTWLDGTEMSPFKADGILYLFEKGVYYRRVLVDECVNMRWYLKEDVRANGEVDNLKAWSKFNAYMRQADNSRKGCVNLIIGQSYYSSDTIHFEGLRYNFIFRSGELTFPCNKRGLQFHKRNDDYYNFEYLRLRGLGEKDATGMIEPADPTFRAWLAEHKVPLDIRNEQGQVLSDLLAGTKKFRSFNPADYTGGGIFTTTVLYIQQMWATNINGPGIYFYGVDVTQKDELAPDGYDTSMSYIGFAQNRRCSHGIVIEKKESNHISLFRVDGRECDVCSLLDASQSGAQVLHGHSAVNQWGDYWMLSNGDWTNLGPYAEVNDKVCSIYNGAGSSYGGPLNSTTRAGYGNFVQRGNVMQKTAVEQAFIGAGLEFGDQANRYNLGALRNVASQSDLINLQFGIGGEAVNQGLFGVAQAGQTLPNGRAAQRSGFAAGGGGSRIRYAGQRLYVDVAGFAPPADLKYQRNDVLENHRFRSPEEPASWICVQGGLVGDMSYQQLGGPRIRLQEGRTQEFILEHTTNLLEFGDALVVGKDVLEVVSVRYDDAGKLVGFSLHAPAYLHEWTMIDFPRAKFQVLEQGIGEWL